MTGGTPEAETINLRLAEIAQEQGLAMGVGSQRAALEHAHLAATYQVRRVAPDILLFANLGAVQLNYQYTIDHCQRAVDMIQADALILHLNPLQEALQPEGDTHFAGLLKRIEAVCQALPVPVVAKEVGWGVSAEAARQLISAGISAIDIAGAGGTSWSQVEMYRNGEESGARVAAAFRDWGIPTALSIQEVRSVNPDLPILASGGLKDGIDIAKCIALGANLGGMAGVLLRAAAKGAEDARKLVLEIRREIQVCMFAVGAKDLPALKKVRLYE